MFRFSHQPRSLVWKQFIVRPQYRAEMADMNHNLVLMRAVKETAHYFTQVGMGRGVVKRSKPDYVEFDNDVTVRAGTWNVFVFTVSENPHPYQIKTMVIVPPPEDTIRHTLEVHDGLYVDGRQRDGADMVEQVIQQGIGFPLGDQLLGQVEDSLHKHWQKVNGKRLY